MSNLTYRDAGQDLDLYGKGIDAIAPLVTRTHGPRVLDKFGGFASLFSLEGSPLFSRGWRKPVLVTCNDGVGTKLKVAAMMRKFDTVGIDLVAMSANDALCTGGEPMVFLDYIALPKDDPDLLAQLVKGISDGCIEAGCALAGGETAILPDFYAPGDFDMAGFCVGVVERDEVIDGRTVQAGDAVVGLSSSGLHSNGYSLARKIAFQHAGLTVGSRVDGLARTVGEELLEPTRLYPKALKAALAAYPFATGTVRALAHITGEGLEGNIPRVLPEGKKVVLHRGSWPVPPVFGWLQRAGGVDEAEMHTVFNMGIGFVMIVAKESADGVVRVLGEAGYPSQVIGEVRAGEPGVEFA
ncbi:MAG: phosphoribosylformylglycinamidine cyclo-ligase, partial [Gemmataceae bacterium]|nr:phosphoribosylformylglycinamidine cyclo-ligase [Gemmataceae bacterium]